MNSKQKFYRNVIFGVILILLIIFNLYLLTYSIKRESMPTTDLNIKDDYDNEFEVNGNILKDAVIYKDLTETIKTLGHNIFYFQHRSLDTLKQLLNNKTDKIIIFFETDTDEPLNVPENIILYRTSLLRSHKKPTEFVFPIIYPNELEYSLVGQLEPVKKSEKPRICFIGASDTHPSRIADLEYLKSNSQLSCDFVYKKGFRGGSKQEMIDNMRDSEFVFCPRGTGNFSIRFYETLYYGRIPVIIDTDIVLPFPVLIHWDEIIVMGYSKEDLPGKIVDFWRNNDIIKAQNKCRAMYKEYFSKENVGKYMIKELEYNNII